MADESQIIIKTVLQGDKQSVVVWSDDLVKNVQITAGKIKAAMSSASSGIDNDFATKYKNISAAAKRMQSEASQILNAMKQDERNFLIEVAAIHQQKIQMQKEEEQQLIQSINRENQQRREAAKIQQQLMRDQAAQMAAYNSKFNFSGSFNPFAGFLASFDSFMLKFLSLYSLLKAVREIEGGIKLADQIRDADFAIKTYATNAKEAAISIDYFNKAQDKTRSTTLELKQLFNTISPKGVSADVSQQTLRELTLDLTNIANLRQTQGLNVTPEALGTSYANVIGGKLQGSNSLMKAIGITIEQVKEWKKNGEDWISYINDRIKTIGQAAGGLGDSFESASKKIKFNLMSAFADGFNAYRDRAAGGIKSIEEMSIKMAPLMEGLGRVVSRILQLIGGSADAVSQHIENVLGTLKSAIEGIAKMIGDIYLIMGKPLAGIDKLMISLYQNKVNNEEELFAMYRRYGQSPKQAMDNTKDPFGNGLQEDRAKLNEYKDRLAAYEELSKIGEKLKSYQFNLGINTGKPQYGPNMTDFLLGSRGFGDDNTDNAGETAAEKKIEKAHERLQAFIEKMKVDTDALKQQFSEVQSKANEYSGKSLNAIVTEQEKAISITKEFGDQLAGLNKSFGFLGKDDPVLKSAIDALKEYSDTARKLASDTFIADFASRLKKEGTEAFTSLKTANEMYKALFTDPGGYNNTTGKDIKEQTRLQNIENVKMQNASAKEFAKQLKEELHDQKVFDDQMQSIILAFEEGGGKAGRQLADSFKKLFATDMVDLFNQGLAGIFGLTEQQGIDPKTGKLTTGYLPKGTYGPATPMSLQQALLSDNRYKQFQNAAQFAQIGLSGYYSGANGQKNAATIGAITGAGEGALIGAKIGSAFGIPGAVLGAVAGGIIGWASAVLGKKSAPDTNIQGQFILANGVAYGSAMKNMTSTQATQETQVLQAKYDEITNSIIQILLKVPNSILPKFKDINLQFMESTKEFMNHLDDWINNTVTTTLVQKSKDFFVQAATNLGMSQDKFLQVWGKLSTLDPSKMVELLGTLFEALDMFQKNMKFLVGNWATDYNINPVLLFETPRSTGKGRAVQTGANKAGSSVYQTYGAQYAQDLHSSFFNNTSTQTDLANLRQMGLEMSNLTGEAQIQKAHDLGQAFNNFTDKIKQAIQDLVNAGEQAHKDFQGMIKDLRVQMITNPDGSPDYAGQAAYAKQQADNALGMMQHSQNLQDLDYWKGEFIKWSQQSQGAWASLGGDNVKNSQQWLIDALNKADTEYQKAIGRLGEDVNKTADKIYADMSPYITQFNNVIASVTDPVSTLVGDIGRLHDPIDRIIPKMNDLGDAFDTLLNKVTNSSGYKAKVLTARGVAA